MTRGDRVAAAARALIGTRFRLHGRDAHGVDCVGLVALAVRGAGYAGEVPTGYALRSGDPARLAAAFAASGFVRARGAATGDVIAVASGPGQLHLAVAVDGGFVHADLALGRVVEQPGAPPWPVVGRWRMGRAAWRRSY